MACRGCSGHVHDPHLHDMRVFTFPFDAGSGIELRTWGRFTYAQAALTGQWVQRILALILVDHGARPAPPEEP